MQQQEGSTAETGQRSRPHTARRCEAGAGMRHRDAASGELGYRRCKAAGANDGSATENVDHHDTLDWANLLLEDGGDGRRVDSSGDGDGSSGADGAYGCCGDAEAGWRLLMAVTGLTGAARRSAMRAEFGGWA